MIGFAGDGWFLFLILLQLAGYGLGFIAVLHWGYTGKLQRKVGRAIEAGLNPLGWIGTIIYVFLGLLLLIPILYFWAYGGAGFQIALSHAKPIKEKLDEEERAKWGWSDDEQ